MLETKIDKLTDAVERLIAKLDRVATLSSPPLATTEAVAAIEQVAPLVAQVATILTPEPDNRIDREALKSQCLRMIREKRELKDQIKAITASYGATTIDNVPEDKLADLKLKIEALK